MLATLLLLAVRAALLLSIVLIAMRVLRRTAATTRRSVLVAGVVAVLALPIASAVLPALRLRGEAPPTQHGLVESSVPDTIVEADVTTLVATRAGLPATTTAPPVDSASRMSWPSILIAVWAAGALAVLARLCVGLVRARRLVRAARFVTKLEIDGRAIEIRRSPTVETPAVTGLLVPVVLLPRDADTWSEERGRIVLAHELAHIRHHDFLASVLAQIVVALHWFDPLAWFAARRLRIERELAADERVIAEGVLASRYAEHLLALATRDRAMHLGALAMADAGQLSVRIRALVAAPTPLALGRARYALLVGAVAIAAFVACATPERESVPAAVTAPVRTSDTEVGSAAATTIDPQLQAIVEEELQRMNTEWTPCAAIVLVLDPRTGNVVAVAYQGTEATASLAATRPLVPGSTMKPLVVAAALEEGVLQPGERFTTAGAVDGITDERASDALDVREILARSSNVGVARIFDRLGGMRLATWQKRFHLAAAPATIAEGPQGAPFAIGAKVSSTPLEMAAAFATLANGGVYHRPTFVPRPDEGERVVRADTAHTVLSLLEAVTEDGGTGVAARIPGVRVAGKTGTAHLGTGTDSSDYYSSFVGTAPLDAPRYVVFVGAETPRDGGTGGQVAAPVFGRVMARLLAR